VREYDQPHVVPVDRVEDFGKVKLQHQARGMLPVASLDELRGIDKILRDASLG
jgi:hypothetical protein